jgi:hypothetical protein
MTAGGEHLADHERPWVGLASFAEADAHFFAGRGEEVAGLLRLVHRDTLTLLYGVSGLGKTSLLHAGLFPALRVENFLPVPIRLDYLDNGAPLAGQVYRAIADAALSAGVERPESLEGEGLWEYFHRDGNDFWSSRNEPVTPILVFDQFEEIFTLGRENVARAQAAEAFITEFAGLVENRVPASVRADSARVGDYHYDSTRLKVLISMREDYLAELDRLRSRFRDLGQNRLRLLPMGKRQARSVIALGESLLAPGAENGILEFVAGDKSSYDDELTIAPALLSLVLRELNERRLALGNSGKITLDLLDIEQTKILESFYLRSLEGLPPGVGIFIEDALLTASGYRNSCAIDDALTREGVTMPILEELVTRRLLAYEDRHQSRRVELTHDVLVGVIKASRDTRRTREERERTDAKEMEIRAKLKRGHQIAAIFAIVGLAALIACVWALVASDRAQNALIEANKQRSEAVKQHQEAVEQKSAAVNSSDEAERQRADALKKASEAEVAKKEALEQKEAADEERDRAKSATLVAEKASQAALAAKADADLARDEATKARVAADELIYALNTDLRDKLKESGRVDIREAASKLVEKHYKDYPPTDRAGLRGKATNLDNRGDIQLEHDNVPDAIRLFKESEKIRRDLLRKEPLDRDIIRDLCDSCYRLGATSGSAEEALSYFRDEVKFARRLVAEEPLNGVFQFELGDAYSALGLFFDRHKQPLNALEEFKQAAAVLKPISVAPTAMVDWKLEYARCLKRRAIVFVEQKRVDAAILDLRDSLTVLFRLEDPDRKNARWMAEIVECETLLGDNLKEKGQVHDARAEWEKGRERAERLHALDPANRLNEAQLKELKGRQ